MEIDQRKEENVLVVSVKGRVDAGTAGELDEAIGKLIEGGERFLVFDLKELDYISSAGLRSFLMIAKKIKATSGKLALFSLQEMVLDVFEVSGFNKIIPIFDTVSEAISATT